MEVCCDAGNFIFLEAMQPMPDFTLFTPEELTSYEPPAFPKTLYEFPLDKIVYFREIGDVQYTTEISGGKVTGGGSSIGGAVVGGLLAGDAGAIIGSRKKIESEGITTNVVEHDSRQVVLKLTDNEIEFLCNVISSHMGIWNRDFNDLEVLPKPKDKYERFVHLCDYLSSKKFMNIQFDGVDIAN